MIIAVIIAFLLGILVGFKFETFFDKSKSDWELYDTITGKWNLHDSILGISNEYSWYEIYYSPSKDCYKLKMGGYNPKQHGMYNEAVKVLRENNKAARNRKEEQRKENQITQRDADMAS